MANIFDYIDWRGDLSFEASPFNEVDNLVLAQLSYTDFDGCVPTVEEGGEISFQDLYKKYYEMHTKGEILARTSFIAKAPLLMDTMKDAVRFKDIKFKGYINNINKSKDEQMSAVQMWLPDGTVYLAYRGTDDTFIGWKEDLCFSYMEETEGQRSALQYLNDNFNNTDKKLRIGGHSKGGNFAIYAAAFSKENIRNQIIEVWSNDGPGFMHEVTEREEYKSIQPKIHAIVPECSVIGMLMYSLGTKKVIHSSGKGLMQHDANTWQMVGNHFEEVEGRNSMSVLADKTIRGWLNGLSLNDRKIFINTVFDILDSSGATCVSQFNASLFANLPKIIGALGGLTKQQAQNVRKVMFDLAKSYVGETTQSFMTTLDSIANELYDMFIQGD